MASTNPHTGATMQSKASNENFRTGFDGIDWSATRENNESKLELPERKDDKEAANG